MGVCRLCAAGVGEGPISARRGHPAGLALCPAGDGCGPPSPLFPLGGWSVRRVPVEPVGAPPPSVRVAEAIAVGSNSFGVLSFSSLYRYFTIDTDTCSVTSFSITKNFTINCQCNRVGASERLHPGLSTGWFARPSADRSHRGRFRASTPAPTGNAAADGTSGRDVISYTSSYLISYYDFP